MSIKGFKSQQALQQKLAGYTEEQSIDPARYATLQEMSGRRHAIEAIIQGAYQITVAPLTVAAGSNIRTIKCTGHGASKNDIIRLSNGTQFSALSVPDANTIITSVELDISPTGDTFTIWRHITPACNADGSLQIGVAPAPIMYNRKSAGVTATVSVLEDLDTPAASKPLPVAIHSIDGAGITVNAGDLSVSTSHVNDSMSLGDGTTLVGVTASNALKVAITQPQTGSFAEDLTVTTTPETFTAPVGAFACFVGTKDTNPKNIRVVMGGVASPTSGIQFQPGRSEFYQGGSNISYCTESGVVGEISVQWFIR